MKDKRNNAMPSNEHPVHPKRGMVPPEATEIEWCSSDKTHLRIHMFIG
jgi:hypothetical protein